MSRLLFVALITCSSLPMDAQQNPFKPVKQGIKGVQVTYSLTGDIAGTATLSLDGNRLARRQTSTMKVLGKTTATDTWTLTTEDSTYTADLTKKEGLVAPNMLPSLSKAYENLDAAGQKRFHENAKDLASILARGFGVSTVSNFGERTGKKSYAGQECEERTFGGFTICTMSKVPISLHSQGRLVCFTYEETATAVQLSAPGDDAFTPPAGIAWSPNKHLRNVDSMTTGYVLYLASQQLADSLAKAKAQLGQVQAQAQSPGVAGGATVQQTPEQKAAMQQACDAIKNFDMGKVMADATSQMGKEIADAMKRAAVDAAKNAAGTKLKGLFKPRIP